jgi:peptidoglycan L-alanyl-D-glutamate endopeptidase CwlK
MHEVIKSFDYSAISGHRQEEEQNELFSRGLSRLKYPHSSHNAYPSEAIDIAPYDPILGSVDWNDHESFYVLSGHVLRVAWELRVPLRCGTNWDMDADYDDQTFFDLGHYELVSGREGDLILATWDADNV